MAGVTDCPVCRKELDEPKILPCNHTLCLKCLENLEKEQHVKCPECDVTHKVPDRGVKSFVENQHATQLIADRKEMEAMKKFIEAEFNHNGSGEPNNDSVAEVSNGLAECSLKDEDEKDDTACARPQDGAANFSANPKAQSIPTAEANLLTFSRQKLALLQSEYDPKCCSHCNKSGDLKSCTKCKTAKYCSRECQVKDWGTKHNVHCKEIKRLNKVIEREEKPVRRILHASPCGRPWPLENDMDYYKIAFLEDKVFPLPGSSKFSTFRPFNMYNTTTGAKEGTICEYRAHNKLTGFCALKVGDSRYLAISHGESQYEPWRIDFWPFPVPAARPTYTYTADPCTVGNVCLDGDKLLVANMRDQTIHEFDVSAFPIKRTGVVIRAGLIPWVDIFRNMCVMTQDGEKRIVFQYNHGHESILRCINYRGQQLWEIEKQPLGGILFQPWDICTDNNGHLFTADGRRNRVIVINSDCSLQVLLATPGMVTSLGWCDVTQKLYVIHLKERKQQMMMSRYDVSEL